MRVNMIDRLIDEVRDILDRYTTDETGESQRDKFEAMGDLDILQLIINTLNIHEILEDTRDLFETDVVINFDYGNY